MASVATPDPWPPYDSYKDCSQGICSLYCPQWCYIIFPPPPPFFLNGGDGDSSGSDFSPLLIALIGVLASAFILVSYYTVISKFCHRHRNNPRHRNSEISSADNNWQGDGTPAATAAVDGLDEALIKSIRVYKYRKGDEYVECTDCSVCLSEFEENDGVRLLPKCNHAFHVHCIDTWLKSHSNCPLCRAEITAVTTTAASVAVADQPISVHSIDMESGNRGEGNTEMESSAAVQQHQTDDSVAIIEVLEIRARDEAVVNVNLGSPPKQPEQDQRDRVRATSGGEEEERETQPIRRSVSLNSVAVISIADILREIEDEENDEESIGAETSRRREEEEEEAIEKSSSVNQRNGVSNFLVRSSTAMKRSVSTGRFIFTRCDRGRTYRLPD